MSEKNCSNCKVGLFDKHTNIGCCPYYTPKQGIHCALWEPLGKDKKENTSKNESEKPNRI